MQLNIQMKTDQVMNNGDKVITQRKERKAAAKAVAISVFSSPYWSKNKSVVTNVSDEGFTIVVHDVTYFAPFVRFPWFNNAVSEHIFNVLGNFEHMYWPDLDVDLREDDFKELAVVVQSPYDAFANEQRISESLPPSLCEETIIANR